MQNCRDKLHHKKYEEAYKFVFPYYNYKIIYCMGTKQPQPARPCFRGKGLLITYVQMMEGFFKCLCQCLRSLFDLVCQDYTVFQAPRFIFNVFPQHFQIKILFYKD